MNKPTNWWMMRLSFGPSERYPGQISGTPKQTAQGHPIYSGEKEKLLFAVLRCIS